MKIREKFLCLFCAVPLLVVATISVAKAGDRVTNQEYRFSVSFPNGSIVCRQMSGEHPHGFYVLFKEHPIDCHDQSIDLSKPSSIRGMAVYAYGNSSFDLSPDQSLASVCGNNSRLKGLTFRGHRSAACEVKGTDGTINIYVATQAGEWPGRHDAPEWNSPYINFTASLHTNTNTRAVDIASFRQVLSSVEINFAK